MPTIHHLTVLGSGVLGGQIAWHSAFKDKNVTVYDIAEDALARCKLAHAQYAAIYQAEFGAGAGAIAQTQARLTYTTELQTALRNADLVIEAVPEIPDVKHAVYRQMAPLLPAHTLLATNSSMLLPSDFAASTGRPAQFCALHFANLIWRMNLAEVMAHAGTSAETLRAVTAFAIEIGMVPIPVRKVQNGYVLNTWLTALLNAAQTLVTNGVATPEDVDRSYLICNRGAGVGPMGIIDVIGMGTIWNVMSHWGNVNKDEQTLRNAEYIRTCFIEKGRMGLASGEGYYRYPDPAYQAAGFLDVPDVGRAGEIAGLVLPGA